MTGWGGEGGGSLKCQGRWPGVAVKVGGARPSIGVLGGLPAPPPLSLSHFPPGASDPDEPWTDPFSFPTPTPDFPPVPSPTSVHGVLQAWGASWGAEERPGGCAGGHRSPVPQDALPRVTDGRIETEVLRYPWMISIRTKQSEAHLTLTQQTREFVGSETTSLGIELASGRAGSSLWQCRWSLVSAESSVRPAFHSLGRDNLASLASERVFPNSPNPRANSNRPSLSHMTIPEPITATMGRECSNWAAVVYP